MEVAYDEKLDLLLLVGGEELQKLLETLPEQQRDYPKKKLDQHLKANHKKDWSCTIGLTPNGHPTCTSTTKCREQALLCDLPITLDNAIMMMTVVKTNNVEVRNEIVRKMGT